MDLTRRRFLEDTLLAAAAVAVARAPLAARVAPPAAAEPLRIAVLGVRGRGRDHIASCRANPDAEVVAICDPDEDVIGPAARAVPDAKYVKDFRAVLEDPKVDAVTIATPNHWHALAAVWALQAGKHVYVEKPISWALREGALVAAAARKYGGVLQHGTQARSHAACRDGLAWLQQGGLGAVRLATGLCYKDRKSIGKTDGPQPLPPHCDFDLWTGPAALLPLRRKSLHYDWHWDWNTGNGDIGNQGVHQMDLARWGLGVESFPTRVAAVGGRFGYEDDGQTPNTQICLYDWGAKKIIFEVRGLPSPEFRGARIGTIFHAEGGWMVIQDYEKAVAFDGDGKVMKTFAGGGDHFADFLAAVRAKRDGNAPAQAGHLSAGLCHLGNIAWRLGSERPLEKAAAAFGDDADGAEAYARFRAHLLDNGLAADAAVRSGDALSFDPAAERFIGARAAEANALTARAALRAPFVFPQELGG